MRDHDGRSIDTTMGFTPLEGLVMATRSGSVDPGMLLWLLEHERLSAAELADALEHRSGLLGLAGTRRHARGARTSTRRGDESARLALDVYLHRLRAGIAAMTARLGGLDVLVFTGGVGERSPEVRSARSAGLGFLGAHLDDARNQSGRRRTPEIRRRAGVGQDARARRARGSRDSPAGQDRSGL